MDTPLLTTNLRIPPQKQHLVRRDRLIDALEQGIPRHKLVVISSPAGYGKTTMLSHWAHASRLPVAWLSVSEENNDVRAFLRCLITAWAEVQPSARDGPLGVLLGAMMPDRKAILSVFINVGSHMRDHVVFVVDDYDLIHDPSVHQAVTFLLDHLPPMLHFVLASRRSPPLPLARYRAHRELLEFRTDDLQFTVVESEAFLNGMLGLSLRHDELAPLHTQLEGWVAGLQLVSLTLQRGLKNAEQLVVSGRHRFIADYLSGDVVDHLPNDLRRFLLQTSILDRLCGALCDAVTGGGDGQAMLETLERENLFLLPLDDSREWYRYHRLFADFLRAELHRRYLNDVAHLHRRAARWYLAQDQSEPAFHHAVTGDDPELVLRILNRYESFKLHAGEFSVLKRWLDSLPAAWYASHPLLGLSWAGLLAFTGALDACIRWVDHVETRLVSEAAEATRWQLARVTAFRCFVACFQNDLAQAEMQADRALRDLREEDRAYRTDIYHALGDTYRANGHWAEAKAAYLKVLDLTHGAYGVTGRLQSAHVFGALADLELRQGRLQEAAGYWRKAMAAFQDRENRGRLPLPVIGWVYTRMGELLYEWDQLREAWDYLSLGLEHAELGGDVRTLIVGCVMAGRAKLVEGEIETAMDYLERARPLVEEASFPDCTGRFERLQLDLWLAQDRLRASIGWADRMLENSALQERPEPELTLLSLAHVLIVKGDAQALGRAQKLLGQVLQTAEAAGRMGIQIEALAQQALVHWRRGDQASAMTSLEHALRLAEPEGYVRVFADLGLPIARLLQAAQSRGVIPDYVAKLLAACGDARVSHAGAQKALPEPLTRREQEILGLVAAGLTNQEIAATLNISPETVKKHASNIYGKLGVRRRTEAVARARELVLLG